jgi:hypothetical protein
MPTPLRRRRPWPLAIATTIAAVAAIALGGCGSGHPDRPRASGAAGDVRFVKRTDRAFDRYTDRPTAAFRRWMRGHLWRAVVYTPYFDRRTRWYPGGWVYRDLYAIGRGSALARRRPEWILRDARGRRLYIPWGCAGGTCPQYAGDVTDPAFRRSFVASVRRQVARGYRGVWLDDVNLERRVSDGDGSEVAPVDRSTGRPLSARAWRRAVARFAEEVRRALPRAEIVHNAIWFAAPRRGRDPFVRRQIAAADYVNLERGVNDAGLRGGDGRWSLRAFLRHVDRIHAEGRAVVLDGFDDSPTGREYALAAYLLVSGGRDGIGLAAMTPRTWWRGFDVALGAPFGRRTAWQGLLRRDFAGGTVLLNPPESPARTVRPPAGLVDLEGRPATEITLGAARGAVLRRR